MRKLEFFTSLFLVVFSGIVCQQAYRISLGKPGAPGPGLFPFLLAVLLLVFSVLYIFKALRLWRREQEIRLWKEVRWGKVVLVLALLLLYAVFLEKGGFLLCTFLFLMFLFRWVDRQRWYWVYLGSIGIAVACYAIFKVWLMIQLPSGILGI